MKKKPTYKELEDNIDQANGCLMMIRDTLIDLGEDMSGTPGMMYNDSIIHALSRHVLNTREIAARVAEEYESTYYKSKIVAKEIARGIRKLKLTKKVLPGFRCR